MNDATAALLALVLVLAVGADLTVNDGAVLTFLGRRMIELIEYLAFWR